MNRVRHNIYIYIINMRKGIGIGIGIGNWNPCGYVKTEK